MLPIMSQPSQITMIGTIVKPTPNKCGDCVKWELLGTTKAELKKHGAVLLVGKGGWCPRENMVISANCRACADFKERKGKK